MEVEIETSPADYSSFFRYFFLERNILRKIIAVLLLSYLFAAFVDDPRQKLWSFMVPKTLLISIAVFPLYFLLPYFYSLYRFKSAYRTSKSPLGKRVFTTTDQGVNVTSNSETLSWKWEALKIIGENKNYVFFLLFNYKLYLIPKRYFSGNEADNFLATLKNGQIKFRGNPKPSSPVSLYWWGLLCLIPGVGAIAGFILLLRGIIEFRDTVLIAIGAIGILVSIYFYPKLFHDSAPEFEMAWQRISQTELNTLMKEIEFYKIQNGKYPESLAQIGKNNSSVLIDDPLQRRNKKGDNTQFNFKNFGDKYELFSSGVDGIPNTADDLYPIYATSDSSKFGLLKTTKKY